MHRLDPNHLLANLRVVLVEAPNYVKNSLLASMSLPSTGSISSQMPDLASQMVLSWMPRGCGFLGKYDIWASLAPALAIIILTAHKTSPRVQRLFPLLNSVLKHASDLPESVLMLLSIHCIGLKAHLGLPGLA